MNTKRNTIFFFAVFSLSMLLQSCYEKRQGLDEVPIAVALEADRRQVRIGDTVNFSDMSTGLPSRWSWKFEGGSPDVSILHSPSVVYHTPGTYSVTLQVTRENVTETFTWENYVEVGYWNIVADFNTSVTQIMEGESVTFNDISTGFPESWLWEFTSSTGTVLTSDEQNPTLVFDEPGFYTVKLTASNAEYDDVIVKEQFLTVVSLDAVQADFASDVNSIVAGGSVTFEDLSSGEATAWNWSFEGASQQTSTERNPTVTYPNPGRYGVTLEVFDVFGSSTKTVAGHILVVPSNGLVAYYPFDGHANDIGPHAIHPSNINGVTFTGESRQGASDGTAVFDRAARQLLLVPDNDRFNFGTGDYTVSVWIRTPLTTVTQMNVWTESGANGAGDNQTWLRVGQNATTQLMRFCIEGGGGSNILNTNYSIFNTAWHHVVCVRAGLTTRIYVNGAQVAQLNATVLRPVSNAQPFKIGAQETSGGGTYSNFFNGQMDDFLIYNRALSAQEVANLYGYR